MLALCIDKVTAVLSLQVAVSKQALEQTKMTAVMAATECVNMRRSAHGTGPATCNHTARLAGRDEQTGIGAGRGDSSGGSHRVCQHAFDPHEH